MARPINVTITGDYNDKDIKRAIKDLESLQKNGPKTASSLKSLKVGLAAAATAAAAFAIKLGVDAVQAAMDEEAEVSKLNNTLKNLGFGAASDQVAKFVDDLQFATGVSDSQLRPALATLAAGTKDLTQAQQLLKVALDLSASGFGDVSTTSAALAKASAGNMGALQRLTRGAISPATVKAKDFNKALEELAKMFGGAAAAAANTMSGKFAILKVGVDELMESFGVGMIEGFVGDSDAANKSADELVKQLREMQPSIKSFGEAIGGVAKGILFMWDVVRGTVSTTVYLFVQQLNSLYDIYINLADALGLMTDEDAAHERSTQAAIKSAQQLTYQEGLLGHAFGDVSGAASDAADSNQEFANWLSVIRGNAEAADTSLKQLQGQMDRMAKNRSIAQQRLGLAKMRTEGPNKSGSRKGAGGKTIEFATGQDLREFGLQYADQAQSLAMDIVERGNFSAKSKRRARQILTDARTYLRGLGMGRDFTSRNGAFLGTPTDLRPGARPPAAAHPPFAGLYTPGTTPPVTPLPAPGQPVPNLYTPGATTNTYIFNGDLNVASIPDAIEQAKKAARLAKIGGDRYAGMAASGKGWG